MNELQPLFEAKHPGITLVFNYGASGTLQKQIQQGAPTDVFLSAAAKPMNALAEEKIIDAATVKNLLVNDLVVVVPADGGLMISSLADLKRDDCRKIAIGTPETVPAGSYAQESLTGSGLWEVLQPKFVFAKDVKQVLSYVESGNTEAGFVYRTDALASTKAKIAFSVDGKLHKPITYPIGIIRRTEHRAEAELLYDYLISPEAAAVFDKYGFGTSP